MIGKASRPEAALEAAGAGPRDRRRTKDGKSRREANRCLKRYLARNLYRLLENPPMRA